MQCYTELTVPTAVTHTLSLPFLSPSANNLIVAKSSLLQIFSFKSVVAQKETANTSEQVAGTIATSKSSERLPSTKLILIAQYELSGTITSLARVKILNSKSGAEALLVALKDAKLSLVEWDPERYSISTISIHYYEREDVLSNPWDPDLSQCRSYLTVDPSSRCAALKFGARHLAILPFRQMGDDLVMDEYDPGIQEEKMEEATATTEKDDKLSNETPYAASFVLSLLALNPVLTHPVHLAFLYEYREPTFGILYSQGAQSSSLLHERKDNVSYAVYTIDIEQRASTALLSVNKLPYDLHTIVPLSRVIGGVLLVGANEIIHVDQSGKAISVAVNELAKQSTSFAMNDQSNLEMKLEGCIIKQLGSENTDLLLILDSGELAIISFKIDGRSVAGLSIRQVGKENGGHCLHAGASCASIVGRGRIFVGSEEGDPAILGWSQGTKTLKRRRSQAGLDSDIEVEAPEVEAEEVDDEDDLYATEEVNEETSRRNAPSNGNISAEYTFRVHDTMLNPAPLGNVTVITETQPNQKVEGNGLEMITTSGRGKAGALTSFRPEVLPKQLDEYDIAGATAVWAIRPTRTAEDEVADERDTHLIVCINEDGQEECKAYSLLYTPPEEIKDVDFDPEAGKTIEIGMLNDGLRVVHVLASEVRTYDAYFSLAQIIPLSDEDADSAPHAISASFADPFVSIIRSDGALVVFKVDESGDLDEVEKGPTLQGQHWTSSSLYEDSNDVFRLEYGEEEDDSSNVLLFLLSSSGGLHIFRLPSLRNPVYTAEGLSFLPPFLSSEFTVRRSAARESVAEILVAELGDTIHRSPFLILRSALDEVIIYQPYQSPIKDSKDTALRFLKSPNTRFPRLQPSSDDDNDDEDESLFFNNQRRLRAVQNLNGYDVVFISGPSSSLLIKSASTRPQVFPISDSPITHVTPIHSSKCPNGFACTRPDSNTISISMLHPDVSYSSGMVTQTSPLHSTVTALTHHAASDTLVVGLSHPTAFVLPTDEPQYQNHNPAEINLAPSIPHSSIRLLDRVTRSTIGQHELDPYETILCATTVSLEVSELTNTRKSCIAIGTALIRGEDLPALGRIYIFSIIDVVPDPERQPETSHGLKLLAKEEVRGAVTALSGVGTQGFLLMAQGQKLMVRGLKEDGTFLPVAFMDVACYVSVIKELKGQEGLCLVGDAVKGVTLVGYMEDPYTLRTFSKSSSSSSSSRSQHSSLASKGWGMETITADFLPSDDGKALYVVVADAEGNIQIVQFDPENPKSLSGTRLLPTTSFHTGHPITSMLSLPSSFPSLSLSPFPQSSHSNPTNPSSTSLLMTTSTGTLCLLTPLSSTLSQLLTAMQSQTVSSLPHPLGLNPRAYRSVGSGAYATMDVGGGGGLGGLGGVVDGNMVRRFREGGSWKGGLGGVFAGAGAGGNIVPVPVPVAAGGGGVQDRPVNGNVSA